MSMVVSIIILCIQLRRTNNFSADEIPVILRGQRKHAMKRGVVCVCVVSPFIRCWTSSVAVMQYDIKLRRR